MSDAARGGHLPGAGDSSLPGREDDVSRAVRAMFGRDSIYMLVWAVQLVAAALVTPFVTRLLTPPQFGRVAAANAVMQVLFVVAGLGLSTALQRQYAGPGGHRDAPRVLGFALVAAALVTAVADLTGPLWSPVLGFGAYQGAVRLAVFWAGVSAMTNTSLALLRSQDRLRAFGVVSLLQSVVAEVTSLVLVVVAPTATMFLLGQLSVQIVATVTALALAPPRMVRPADRRLIAAALAFGLPLLPAVLCTFVLNSADRLLLQSQMGAIAVARYQVAYNVGALPILLVGVLNSSWMPRIFSLAQGRERSAVLAASRDLLYKVLAPVVIGMAAGAPIVLSVWAPASYRPEELLLVNALVVVSVVPYTSGLSSTRALMAEGRTVFVAVAQGIAAAANVVLNLVLIPRWGLAGSAAATFLAFALLHEVLLVRARALIPLRPSAGLRVGLLAVIVLALTTALLPATGFCLIVRCVVTTVCLVWFGLVVRGAAGGPWSLRSGRTPGEAAEPRPARHELARGRGR
jgi:O-antigen/teichoic acid export membrane protein